MSEGTAAGRATMPPRTCLRANGNGGEMEYRELPRGGERIGVIGMGVGSILGDGASRAESVVRPLRRRLPLRRRPARAHAEIAAFFGE